MTNTPSKTRRVAAIAVLTAVAWMVQLAVAWEPPHPGGEDFHNHLSDLTRAIEPSCNESGWLEAPERQIDPKALFSAVRRSASNSSQRLVTLAGAAIGHFRPYTRPAIRAPPRSIFSV